MQNLVVTLIQTELVWQDAPENLSMFAEYLAPLVGKTDLIVLPEMFNSGFSMQPEVISEPENGSTFTWLKQQAAALGAAICGSLATTSEQGYSNRFVFVTPEGDCQHYDKRHLFRMGNEHAHYTQGQERVIIEYRGWRVLPQICYDLRFPVWSRNRQDYDLAIYVANWPGARRHAWRTLLQARAIENQCYVVGVNRIGADGNGLNYSGDSVLVDFAGDLILDREPNQRFVETVELNAQALETYRKGFPAWMDADQFTPTK